MQKNKMFKLGLAALFAMSLVACKSSETPVEEEMPVAVDTSANNGSNTTAVAMPANNGASSMSAREMAEQEAALATTVFYFEFDRSDLDAEARQALIYHANRLKENPGMRIRLEGHADERGTREYNIALGERRAQAIERYLQVQGVSAGQMETISYGEESPVATGSSQAAYARNRRVEIH